MMALPAAIASLAQFPRWVGWRWTLLPDGRRDKPPFRAAFPDFHASTTDPRSWTSFQVATASLAAGRLDGIGYVCAEDADRVYWDLDKCRDPVTGEIAPWAQAFIEEADSYTEITPSQCGVRIIGTHGGALQAPIHAAYQLPGGGTGEVFFRAVRYITVTGDRLPGTPDRLSDISGPVLDLLAKAGKAHAARQALPEFGGVRGREEALAPLPDVRAALAVIPNLDLPYDDWVRVGIAAFSATGGTGEGFEAWQAWSAKSKKHRDAECLRVWRSVERSPPRRIGFGTLCYLARAANPLFVAPSWVEGTGSQPEVPHDPADPGEWLSSTPPHPTPPLWVDGGVWDEADIPRRPWLAPGYLLRGSVSCLSGQGSGGKSSVVVCWTIALATGAAVGEFCPVGPLQVVNYNVEDDEQEQRRRYSAALHAANLTPASIAGRVTRCGPRTIGTLFQRDPASGRIVPTAAMAALERLCLETQADALVCDPLAELHNAEENDNTAMRAVIAAFRGLAQRLGIAVLILHHDRKGSSTPGDMDRLRGASAITGAVRVLLTLTSMSEQEAEGFGIQPEHRRRQFRIDGAKSNYAVAQEAEWWQLAGYALANGEEVAACRPWSPPSAFEGLDMAQCVAVLDALAAGLSAGRPWGFDWRAKDEWAGSLLTARGRTDKQATSILGQWREAGTITVGKGESSRRGHFRDAVVTVNSEIVQEMKRQIRGDGRATDSA